MLSQQVKMTLLLAAVAVPINTVFGITCALLIARNEFPGKLIMTSMLDLPFSISPVVTGEQHFMPSQDKLQLHQQRAWLIFANFHFIQVHFVDFGCCSTSFHSYRNVT